MDYTANSQVSRYRLRAADAANQLALTAVIIFMNPSLWAPSVASISDRSLRYTVDKTTREVLFLPLPSALRQEVKPFVDVTVDRCRGESVRSSSCC